MRRFTSLIAVDFAYGQKEERNEEVYRQARAT